MKTESRNNGGATGDGDREKWVHDSSVDHRGRVPLRASTGVWKASFFIITIEFAERLSFFGIASNLITYLTKVMHQNLKTAAKNANYWSGVTAIMPMVGGFLADSYTGRFFMIMFSSILYLMGLSLLTMSQFIPSLKACGVPKCQAPRRVHEVTFNLAIYLISLATGGFKPCLESFGADQFDDDHPEERKQKMSFFNWWNVSLCCGLLFGVTLIAYVEDYVAWGVAAIILTAIMGVSTLVLYFGRPFFRYRVSVGSPLTPLFQVLVAAIAKRNLDHPSKPELLYEVPKSKARLLCHTNNLRFLDKAAIIEDHDVQAGKLEGPWRLATVTQVEEAKLVLNMVPIWLASLMLGVCMSFGSTFFVKQSATMYRRIGHFEIPPASVFALSAIGLLLSVIAYEKILVPVLRKQTGNERGISILQRIGIGLALNILGIAVAAMVERKRLSIAERENFHQPTSMSVFWLTPQYMILAVGDGFSLVGLQEFFYHQVPDSMRSLGLAFYLSVLGVGSFLSSFLITIVDRITTKNGGSWFGVDLNHSRTDKFYWLITAMAALDLCIYVLLAKRYTYKNVLQGAVEEGDHHDPEMTDSEA
nr:protein NRT1/ PTR FAMILY 5.6-like [Ipomoea trifida]